MTSDVSDDRRARLWRASLVLLVSLGYLSHVFHLFNRAFWTAGIGDWMDPHFINALLEHWYRSVTQFRDPSSPPMYFPVRHALGYSHGLILSAPFYVLVRPLLHPLLADNVSLLLLMECGIVCLYLLFRKFGELSVLESLVLSAFFFTSANVTNSATGIWSQRASVFFIPPLLLLTLIARKRSPSPSGLLLAFTSGLLATLLLAQDFPTAAFAVLLLVLLTPIPLLVMAVVRIKSVWGKIGFPIIVLSLAWVVYLAMFGGIDTRIFGIRIASDRWQKPVLIAVVLLVALWKPIGFRWSMIRSWAVVFVGGAILGAGVFLWIYLPAYRELHGFPPNELILRMHGPLQSPADLLQCVRIYDTWRPFALVLFLATVMWIPVLRIAGLARVWVLWFLVSSLFVLIVPFQLGTFSIWRTWLVPIPGITAVRDPRRIIYLYDMAIVLGAGFVMAHARQSLLARRVMTGALVVLIAVTWNRETFFFKRPTAIYDTWVAAPIDVDPSCRSFFIKRASDVYRMQSPDPWMLYGVNATFVALKTSVPTLNGYSGRFPNDWLLFHPHNSDYNEEVDKWIRRNSLQQVCVFDIDLRTMRPYTVGSGR